VETKKVAKVLLAVGAATLVAGVGFYLYNQYLLTDYLCYGTKGFKVKKLGVESSTVEISLSIQNKGELNINLKRLVMGVYANDIFVAQINQDVETSINPFSTSIIPITITFNPKEVLGSALNILNQTTFKEMRFRFDGKAVVRKFGIPIPIPFDFTYTINEMMAPSGTDICEDKSKKNK